MKKIIIYSTLLFLFSSCHETYYQPAISVFDATGFKETKIGENVYQISFSGNRNTFQLTAMNYCFYRCAEFAKENGFKFFMVLETENLTVFWDHIELPCFVKVIKFVSEKPENCQAAVYNADEVIKNLNPIIIKNNIEIQDTLH